MPYSLAQKNLIDLIETIIIYKLQLKSREEIEAMLDLKDLKQTKFYQEAFEDGIEQGRAQGIEQGRTQGIEQGRAQGIEQGIQTQKLAMISILQELGLSAQQIAQRLALSEEIVNQHLEH